VERKGARVCLTTLIRGAKSLWGCVLQPDVSGNQFRKRCTAYLESGNA
jgi:hypothetical protein